MPTRSVVLTTLLAAAAGLLAGGCPDLGAFVPGMNAVTVEIVNDTEFAVDPNIRFDDDSGFFASLVPADTLDTGLIEPGEIVTYEFDCDELGLIRSEDPEQVTVLFGDYVGDSSDTLEREKEYDCGDVIRFRYVGNAVDFGVIVSVNGRIVD